MGNQTRQDKTEQHKTKQHNTTHVLSILCVVCVTYVCCVFFFSQRRWWPMIDRTGLWCGVAGGHRGSSATTSCPTFRLACRQPQLTSGEAWGCTVAAAVAALQTCVAHMTHTHTHTSKHTSKHLHASIAVTGSLSRACGLPPPTAGWQRLVCYSL